MTERMVTLPVRGMTCASCVAHVEKALKGVDGVADVNVNLATEKASVSFSTDVVGIADLVQAVQASGYKVPTETVILPIGGMTCASCAAHVEKALGRAPGVVRASVNLATEKATVTFVLGGGGLGDFKKSSEGGG